VKSLLSRVRFQKALGVYLGEHEIVASLAATTPVGVKELAQHRIEYTGEDLSRALPEALSPFLGRRRRALPIAIGLSPSRVFFAGHPLATLAEGEVTAEIMLQKMLCSPTVRTKDYIIDSVKINVGKTPVVCLTAVRRKYVANLIEALQSQGVRPLRVEPGPWGLLRLATKWGRAPARVKNVLRIILGDTHGVALLTADGMPCAWRNLEYSPGQEQAAILYAVRILQASAMRHNLDCQPEMLIIHGRAELHEQFREPAFSERLGLNVVCYDKPEMSAAAAAFGLALGALKAPRFASDLSATLKPPSSLWEIFPLGEFVMETALVASMGLLLWIHAQKLEASYQALQEECRRYQCLTASDESKLSQEKKELEQKVGTVRDFLANRILWSNYVSDFSRWIPQNIQLVSVSGECRLDIGDKKGRDMKPKKMLLLRGGIPLPPNETSPPPVDDFLAAIRGYAPLQQDFPNVELTDIKLSETTTETSPMVGFNVICFPPESKRGGKKEKTEKTKK